MFFNNLFKIIGMFLNKDIRRIFKDGYNLVKDDPNFSVWNSLKSRGIMLKGEKIVKHEGRYVISSFTPPLPSLAFQQQAQATPGKENVFTQQMLAQRSAPISFFLSVTYECNYGCIHCSARGRKKGEELSTEQWKEVIRNIQEMGTSVVGFTGGEPLLREDLEELVGAVDERSVSILYTNGQGFTLDKAKALKERGLYAAGISLDSYDKEYFNNFRNDRDAFDNSIDAIKNSREAGLYTMIQTFLRKEDVSKEYLIKFFKLAKKLKAHEVRVLEPIRSGRLFNASQHEEMFFDEVTREKLIKLQFKINRKIGFPKMTSFAHTESADKYGCGAGTQHSYITPNGELLPCDFVPLSFGNVAKEDVKDLWQNMNKIIGIPKIGCFANQINQELREYKNTTFPLEKSISEEICLKHQNKTFPKYYQVLQGKK